MSPIVTQPVTSERSVAWGMLLRSVTGRNLQKFSPYFCLTSFRSVTRLPFTIFCPELLKRSWHNSPAGHRLLTVAGFNSCPQFEGEIPKISPLPGPSIVGTLFYFKTVGLVSIKTIREASRNIYNWTIVYLIIILGYHHVRKWLSMAHHWWHCLSIK